MTLLYLQNDASSIVDMSTTGTSDKHSTWYALQPLVPDIIAALRELLDPVLIEETLAD